MDIPVQEDHRIFQSQVVVSNSWFMYVVRVLLLSESVSCPILLLLSPVAPRRSIGHPQSHTIENNLVLLQKSFANPTQLGTVHSRLMSVKIYWLLEDLTHERSLQLSTWTQPKQLQKESLKKIQDWIKSCSSLNFFRLSFLSGGDHILLLELFSIYEWTKIKWNLPGSLATPPNIARAIALLMSSWP